MMLVREHSVIEPGRYKQTIEGKPNCKDSLECSKFVHESASSLVKPSAVGLRSKSLKREVIYEVMRNIGRCL